MRPPLASADNRPSGRSIDRRHDGGGDHGGSTMSRKRAPIASLLTVCVLLGFSGVASAQDSIAAGEQVYEEHCASCHGEKLRSTGAMPDLKQQRVEMNALGEFEDPDQFGLLLLGCEITPRRPIDVAHAGNPRAAKLPGRHGWFNG